MMLGKRPRKANELLCAPLSLRMRGLVLLGNSRPINRYVGHMLKDVGLMYYIDHALSRSTRDADRGGLFHPWSFDAEEEQNSQWPQLVIRVHRITLAQALRICKWARRLQTVHVLADVTPNPHVEDPPPPEAEATALLSHPERANVVVVSDDAVDARRLNEQEPVKLPHSETHKEPRLDKPGIEPVANSWWLSKARRRQARPSRRPIDR